MSNHGMTLTANEIAVLHAIAIAPGFGAENDHRETYTFAILDSVDLTPQQVGGVLTSLQAKDALSLMDANGDEWAMITDDGWAAYNATLTAPTPELHDGWTRKTAWRHAAGNGASWTINIDVRDIEPRPNIEIHIYVTYHRADGHSMVHEGKVFSDEAEARSYWHAKTRQYKHLAEFAMELAQ